MLSLLGGGLPVTEDVNVGVGSPGQNISKVGHHAEPLVGFEQKCVGTFS